MIQFKNIHLVYSDKIVFNNFSLSIGKGEKVLLRAPSGIGKTSLVKLLLGFEKPNKGSICFSGIEVSQKSLAHIRSSIAYLSQDVDYPEDKVEEIINNIFNYRINQSQRPTKEKLEMLLTEFDLSKEILSKNISQISGGERQRLGLIITILLDRPVWILDEVTSGLDFAMKEKMISYITQVDKTMIIISHDQEWLSSHLIVKEW